MATTTLQRKTRCDHSLILEGQVSSASSNDLVDATKNWPLNILRGRTVYLIDGTGAGQANTAISNTNNTITFQTAWTITPDITSVYRTIIHSVKDYCSKCGGTLFYNDQLFNGGRLKHLTNLNKLAQQAESIITDKSGSSIFNKDLGSALNLILTSDAVDDDEIISYAQDSLNRSFTFLTNQQSKALQLFNYDESELFGQRTNLEIVRSSDDPTVLKVTMAYSSASGNKELSTGPLLIR